MHFSNACKMIRLENWGGGQKGYFFEKMLVSLYHSTLQSYQGRINRGAIFAPPPMFHDIPPPNCNDCKCTYDPPSLYIIFVFYLIDDPPLYKIYLYIFHSWSIFQTNNFDLD